MPARPRTAAADPRLARLTRISAASEISRILAVNAIWVVGLAGSAVRVVFVPEAVHFHPSWYLGLVPLLAYGAAMVAYLRRVEAAGRPIPGWLWMSNVAFEGLLPTTLIAGLWLSGTLPADRALAAPVIMVYAVFLVLSPLRLRPAACVVIGLLAGVGHATLTYASGATEGRAGLAWGGRMSLLYGFGAWMVLGGVAAAFVARSLRTRALDAVDEALARQHAEQEIAVAASVQRGLLPERPPDVAGFRVAFWSRPADATGGDYYDWQPLPDGRTAVSLADVSGHGLGPALMAAFCRAYARAALDAHASADGKPAGGEAPLCHALRRVNALLSADLPPGQFVTFVVAVLTPGDPEVELLSAGHGPLLVHRAASATVETLDAHALPLGVDPGEAFDCVGRVRLAPGDALVLVTDGFTEWRRPDGEMYGVGRVRQAIVDGPADPERLIESLRGGVEAFAAGTPQADDLTAVVVRFGGGAA